MRRIALGRPRKHDVSSQIQQLAAYYRETVLSGRLVQSAISQSYVASVDPGTDERNTTVPLLSVTDSIAICGPMHFLDNLTQETLRLPDIAGELLRSAGRTGL